jgi:hypothetical protein
MKRADRFAYLEKHQNKMKHENEKNKLPSDLKQGNVIQAGHNNFFHLINGCRALHGTETKFSRTPILLDKIEFAVILRVEITKMAAGLNKFLKLGLVIDKIWLCKEEPPTAAISSTGGAVELVTLCFEPPLSRPQTTLADDLLHPFEPATH